MGFLSDTSLMWYKRGEKFVREGGDKSSITDAALFVWHNNKHLPNIMSVPVFSCARTELFYQKAILKLCTTFSVSKKQNQF